MQFDGGTRDGVWPADGVWPREMQLSIDQPSTLLLLLFVRSAWGLADCGIPALDAQPAPGWTSAPDGLDVEAAELRWAADWARALDAVSPAPRAASDPDAETLRLLASELTVETLLQELSPEDFWRTGLDDEALWAWQDACRSRPAPASPEHDVVEWLVPIWRSGLRTIIELPFAGYYIRRLDRERIVVSAATRTDRELYSIALSTL